ncbi:hypothetical protein LOK49_LG03G03472 [Camellia lanceoleosa]|uniref:Uncharacterized protein n=1 Tax=Camellia lanceoleosa TaxID=1840588 RepID=A0ACC0I4B7_9ERIC|nr:hypothetical protein LOK49_LG03G03472 [Camellia lanceoleosa]
MDATVEVLARGLCLIEAEEDLVALDDDCTKAAALVANLCLIVKILSLRPINLQTMWATLVLIWRLFRGVKFSVVEENLFLLQFDHLVDKTKVLTNEPWSFDKHLLLLGNFDGSLQPFEIGHGDKECESKLVAFVPRPLQYGPSLRVDMFRLKGFSGDSRARDGGCHAPTVVAHEGAQLASPLRWSQLGSRYGRVYRFEGMWLQEEGCEQVNLPQMTTLASSAVWLPPTVGVYKLNCDGAIGEAQHVSGLGVIARNNLGQAMASLSEQVGLILVVDFLEAEAALCAVRFARDLGLADVHLEGDSLTMVNAIIRANCADFELAGFGPIMMEIHQGSSFFRSFMVSHVHRTGNEVSHRLPRLDISSSGLSVWMEEVPPSVAPSVRLDVAAS